MSKTTAPLLSFSASGQIGKTLVYSRWKGILYARRHVVPANPNTAAQQATRLTFSWLNNIWRYMTADAQAGWLAYASNQAMTGANAFIKFNLSGLIGMADLTNLVLSPSARSGPAGGVLTLTPGNDLVTVALTAPTLPTGWSIVRMITAAVEQQDPQTGVLYTVHSAEDTSSPYSVAITGLKSAITYVVGAWFEYEKPDGTLAYGPSLQGTALTT